MKDELKRILLAEQYVEINKIVATPEGCEKMKPPEARFFLFGLWRVRGWNFCDSKNPQGKRSAVQFHDFARGLRKNEAARKRGFFCSDCGVFGDGIFATAKVSCGISR